MDVQILDLDVHIPDLDVQILDLHVQIQDLDIQIQDFQPVLDTAAFPQEIRVSDQTNAFLISRTECIPPQALTTQAKDPKQH